mgnify:CR=1 FL=1
MSPEAPKFRPLERFWPYADLPEQPTDEELASLDPDLHDALFGPTPHPFSITLVFPSLDVPNFSRALDLARGAAECRETGSGAGHRYRVRFLPSDAERLREVFEIVGGADASSFRPCCASRFAASAALNPSCAFVPSWSMTSSALDAWGARSGVAAALCGAACGAESARISPASKHARARTER